MSANGVNAVRTYTAPPRWLLEIAQRCNLRVLVGMQGERHYTFLHDKKIVREIRKQVRNRARACAGHPAVLGYLVANEIPASIVRWHGASAVEKFLKQLRDEVKEEDPEALVSYANYPSTEYLDLSFLDLVCFNVFLESQDKYEAYLARLQNLAGNRPLLVTEIGLDSHRNGDKAQAACLDWQIRKTFAAGCAGAFVYAWTDEWYRGGEDVIDWDFGLTSRTREPKLALGIVRKAFEEVPFASKEAWPKVSVVVCTFNGSRTIRECLEGIGKLRYPNYETIVVDDGSTDGAGDIAAEYDVRLIRTENQGLSAARNLGWQSAAGEIVAYIDDDARPDPAKKITQASGARIYQSRMTETLRIVSPTRREVRPTCSFPIAKQSTFLAVTWLSAGVGWRPSMDLMRNSGKPVTTWIFVGERGSEAGNSGSVRLPWSGITIAGPCGRIGNNRWATARPRPCSRESGRKSTIPVATRRGQDTYM